jgi:hypothetical protein
MSIGSKHERKLKALEDGFKVATTSEELKRSEYNALYDPNMRHYFENKHVQSLLYRTGQIDKHGRVIDLEKNKYKISVMQREFNAAEQIEKRRQQEEMDMRVSIFPALKPV